MNPKPRRLPATILAFALATGGATLAAVVPVAAAESPAQAPALAPIATAHSLFAAGRYAEAYGRYADLADAGDPVAASLALAMVVHGPELFGSDWSATSGQLKRWEALATRLAEQRTEWLAAHGGGDE
jgi:hypothetical protein